MVKNYNEKNNLEFVEVENFEEFFEKYIEYKIKKIKENPQKYPFITLL